ncbi:uncharacterized protein PAC_10170 [Phialocephala subalpina]|uniref:Uncharacterized protein n=1 Tax=Phialocephala subalpina TaxID=576137 RepID=A0A1L7X5I7_9HELO|nr:uncharacterized protein PAC_10170 [Phialocephala subalpina]
MDSPAASDSVSLHTVDEHLDRVPRVVRPPDLSIGDTRRECGNEHGLHEVPVCFKDIKELLEPPPALSKSPKPRIRLSMWQQRLLIVLLCLWVVIYGHRALVHHLDANPLISYVRWSPPVLATLLMATTSYVIIDELHHFHQQPAGESLESSLGPHLIGTLFLVVCVIAPFISLPLLDSYTVTYDNEWDVLGGFASLSSWADFIPNFGESLPSLINFYDVDDAGGHDWFEASADRWVVESNEVKALFPDSITFNLLGSGRGVSEDKWNGQEDGERIGVYMPVLPTRQPVFDEMQIQHEWTALTELLTVGLDCEYLGPQQISTSNISSTGSISVSAADAAGCSSTVTLRRRALDEELRGSVLAFLLRLEKQAYENHRHEYPFEAVMNFIEGYRKLLSGEKLVSFKPGWARGKATATGTVSTALDDVCQEQLFLASASPAFVPEDSGLQVSQLQVASCRAKYTIAAIRLTSQRSSSGLFYGVGETPHTQPSITVDNISPTSDRYFVRLMDEDVRTKVNDIFLRHASSISIQGSQWPLTQLREEFSDKYWSRPSPVGGLLMASKVINRSFAHKLSTAAGMTLQEGLPTGFQPSVRPEIHHRAPDRAEWEYVKAWWVDRDIFQSRLLFRLCPYLASIGLTVVLCKTIYSGNKYYDDKFSSPWDVSSIAAKAALLRNSRVKDWLKMQRTIGIKLLPPPSFRVGYWSVHEKQGKDGWRLDYGGEDLPASDPEVDVHQWKWEDRQSSPLIVHPISTAAIALALILYPAIQVLLVLPNSSLTQASYYDIEKLSALLRLRGTLNYPSIFWQVPFVIFPTALLFGLSFCWLPLLYHFYRSRQPWVTLKIAQPAQLSITLDYWNTRFPLGKALRSRHWAVALLAFAALCQMFIPLLAFLHYTPVLDTAQTESFTAVQNFTWRESLSEPTADTQIFFNYALAGLIDGMVSRSNLPQWSSHSGALAAVNISQALPTENAVYGTLRTSFLSAYLDCEKAHVTLSTRSHILNEHALFTINHLDLSFGPAENPVTVGLSDPCVPTTTGIYRNGIDLNKPTAGRQSLCGRWWLHNTASTADHVRPIWLIAMIQGNAIREAHTGRMAFTQRPSALGLVCRPRVKMQTGIVTLAVSRHLNYPFTSFSAEPQRFDAFEGKDTLLNELALAISYGLNKSITSLDHADGGIIANGNIVSSQAFVGDILSYVLHRFRYADCPPTLSVDSLKQAASLVFSSYVSSLASQTGLLKDHSLSESVEVNYFRMNESMPINKTLFSMLFSYILLCVIILVGYGVRLPRQYLLPFAPEPLLNGLRLLCHSHIVSRMEREIPHPEKMSLHSFHSQVESWGLKYRLETVHADGILGVNSMEDAVDGAYRDEPSDADHEPS